MNAVCVLGSINMDLVLSVEYMPKIGETVHANFLKKIPGGKGANQAVAARRLDCEVIMLGCVGNDENGKILLENLEKDGVITKYIKIDHAVPSGTALIMVDKSGNNTIAIYAGANNSLTCDDVILNRRLIETSKILIAQFETPIEPTKVAFKIAKENGVLTILNPAPAREIPEELLKYCDIIIPNEIEAERITGITPNNNEAMIEIGEYFENKGVRFVILTLGNRGAAVIGKGKLNRIEAFPVEVVDTTAAGDSFVGGIARYLLNKEGLSFENLLRAAVFANKVAALTVMKEGAQSSLPYLKEVIDKFGEEEL